MLLEEQAKERQTLLDRVMARNFVEYKEQVDPVSNFAEPSKEEKTDVIDMEDAQSAMLEEDNG